MTFGILNVIGGVIGGITSSDSQVDFFPLLGGLLVGGIWFGFGYYGGLPLVDTVSYWQPPDIPNEINNYHRQGILVLRRRKWAMWASIPCCLGVGAMFMPWAHKTRPTRSWFHPDCRRYGDSKFQVLLEPLSTLWLRFFYRIS